MGSMLKEFKAFALRGNLIDLAVAVVLGIAFTAVIQALVQFILNPIIGAMFGQPDLGSLSFGIAEATILYGAFLTALINFALIALALFLVVKVVNRIMQPRGASPEPPTTRECPYCLTAIPVTATKCSACTSAVDPQPA